MKFLSLFTISLFLFGTINFGSIFMVFADENLEKTPIEQPENTNDKTVHDLTNEERGAILNNFKQRQKEIIMTHEMEVDSEDLKIIESLQNVETYEELKNIAEEKRKKVEENYEHIHKKRLTLDEIVKELDEGINEKKDEIIEANNEINKYIDQIKKNKEELSQIKSKINSNRKLLSDYLVHIYKEQNNIYSGDKIDGIRAIVLGGGNLGDVIMGHNFNLIVEATGEKLVETHRAYVRDLYLLKSKLAKEVNSSRKVKIKLQITKNILEDKIALKQDLLQKTKGSEYVYKKYLRAKVKEEKEARVQYLRQKMTYNKAKEQLAEKYNCGTEDLDDLGKDKCEEIDKIVKAESQLVDKENFTLSWPMNPELGISAFYNDPAYYKEFKSSHDAIDLIAEQGTPLRAPADGYVIYVNEPKLGNYSYVALKHSNGVITVHGHLSKVLVKKYDFVNAGSVFANSGGEIGTAGARIMTTGPHLHMEVIQNGNYIDPLNFLDLTYLNIEDIPLDRHFYKYYEDYKKRFGENKEIEDKLVFRLNGDDEIARQQNAVLKYGVNGFGNWNMWVEEGVEAKIDPSFMICVGIAETGLGRRLKTENNVGNIGNTDSGSTYQFETPRAGIYWMAKTFNNPYLGDYNELRQLSRYGNKDGSIYASDPEHWHNNIVKCLSEMKGSYVKDDFNFRLKDADVENYDKIIAELAKKPEEE